ncbi:MAG: adenylyltransferase/cytidyltransferase family protein [Burkholderiaceae bacterium]
MDFLAKCLDAALWHGPDGPKLGPIAQADIDTLPRPLVFTNGVYDLLHPGHVQLLAQARGLGASLVLALNSDASVRTLEKGADRPMCTLSDRMAVAGALKSVDRITWFESSTPLALILALHPDILVKGGDWPIDQIVGAKEVMAWGGQVHSIPFSLNRSTTQLIQKIRASSQPQDPQK